MKHKEMLGNGVLIKPNGQRFEVNVSYTDIAYNGRVMFKYGTINRTQIHLVPKFWPGEGNSIVETTDEFLVVVKAVYEQDGYWQLIPKTTIDQLPDPIKPLKEVSEKLDEPEKPESVEIKNDKENAEEKVQVNKEEIEEDVKEKKVEVKNTESKEDKPKIKVKPQRRRRTQRNVKRK